MIAKMNKTKTWSMPVLDESQVRELATELNVSETIARVHLIRGLYSYASISDFCNLNLTKIHDPYLLPDMKQAVDRLVRAVQKDELIMVVGDCDADGVSSTALALYALRAFGANVHYLIPTRYDGFGLSVNLVNMAIESEAAVLLTVDCGTEGFLAAEHAKLSGMDLVITDHHEPRNDGLIPECVACVNPKRRNSLYPFPHIAGVGVVFKLMLALCEKLDFDTEDAFNQLIEYVAIGTCADVVSMTAENRVLVDYGCKKLSNTEKVGLRKLTKSAGVRRVDSESIGFFIAPMINAACRLEEPETAVKLLLETDEIVAEELADTLKQMNGERKALQEDLLNHIMNSVPEEADVRNIHFYAGEEWHRGLIGLVAGNISSSSSKPSFVCSIESDGIAYGSCRSTATFHILDALHSCSDLLISYGGHSQAAGFKVEANNLQALDERLNQCALEFFGEVVADEILEIDAELKFSEISLDTLTALEHLAPWGQDNPQPKFYTPGLVVVQSSAFCGGKHLKLMLAGASDSNRISAVAWNMGDRAQDFPNGVVVDVVYSLELDAYKVKPCLGLRIVDIECSR